MQWRLIPIKATLAISMTNPTKPVRSGFFKQYLSILGCAIRLASSNTVLIFLGSLNLLSTNSVACLRVLVTRASDSLRSS